MTRNEAKMFDRLAEINRAERPSAPQGPLVVRPPYAGPPCPTCGVAHPFDNVFCSDGFHAPPDAAPVDVEWRKTLQIAEFRVALRRITERYPPDTVAGRLAADALAKYPNQFENADRENDDEPFDIPEIEGLLLGPQEPDDDALTEAARKLAERTIKYVEPLAEGMECDAEMHALATDVLTRLQAKAPETGEG